jgi:hypothetical protein
MGDHQKNKCAFWTQFFRVPGIKHRVSDFSYHDYTNIWQGFKLSYSDSAVQ